MKYLLLFVLYFPLQSIGQYNLVPNPSFENKSSFAYVVPSISGGVGVSNWYNPNTSTPDYFNECAFPLAPLQVPHSDSAYIGLATYDLLGTNSREYVSVVLLETLHATKSYWVELYCSVGEYYSWYASNNLGIHFSDMALFSTTPYYFNVNAQLKYFNNEIIDDTLNWVKFSGIYQAIGGEQFITLGNFNTDAETTQGMYYSTGGIGQTYFLIDDVSVIPLDSIPGGIPVDAGPDQTIYIGDTAFIGQKISNMPDIWTELSGIPVASNTAGVYVSPSVNTTYVVTRNLNGFYSTDTVTVFVYGLGLGEKKKEQVSIYPIPNQGSFYLKGKLESSYTIQILNTTGSLASEITIQENCQEKFIQTNLSSGTYLVVVKNTSGEEVYREKIVVIE
ncbi:MAG: T9SS type A sorting domain-containing protein [Crocinitomicaceae bacterium]